MSTIKVNSIKNTSTNDGGIAIDNSGHVQIDGQQLPTAGAMSSRRININGAMQVAQRSTSVTGLSSSNTCQTVDRMFIRINGAGTFTISQSTEAPDGFSNSIKWDCTTADSSLGAGDFAYMAHRLEGQDVQHLKKGTSGAEKVTVSFWVRAAQTGTYAFRLMDIDNDRSIGQSYTISAANTWEYKTLTFDGDTTGAFGNDNGLSCQLVWWLAAGTNFTSGAVPTAWEAKVTADEAAGLNVNLASSTSNNFYLTGLQFEVGEKATPFEHRSYGDELARCQRYYYMIGNDRYASVVNGTVYANNNFYGVRTLPVSMRTAPTLDTTDATDHFTILSNGTDHKFDSIIIGESRTTAVELRANSSVNLSGVTAGHAAWMRVDNASAHIAANAEL
tara:strand:- start:397 stop:1563 length:1167 start_codon:yes stop_codon:yes gene_type:complete